MDRVYRDQVLEVEPTGIEYVTPAQRHGSARALFGLWFSANAEIATWMVGLFAVALYGTSLRGAAIGIIIGNLAGFALLGVLATFGPRYGVPQMVASRLAFGRYANALPAVLSFLAGVGWFAINTVFGAYALQTIAHLPYAAALAFMLIAQIVLAVYGYNLIHWFETASSVLLAAGFALLGYATFTRADWHAAFNAHAPLAGGGEIGGIILEARSHSRTQRAGCLARPTTRAIFRNVPRRAAFGCTHFWDASFLALCSRLWARQPWARRTADRLAMPAPRRRLHRYWDPRQSPHRCCWPWFWERSPPTA